MSPIEFRGDDILVDGVPGKQLVGALKAAGLSDESVTALLGEALARASAPPAAAAAAADATAAFTFQTPIAETAPDCAATYSRGFSHPDFFDGLTVVQAGQTPEELGSNFRIHKIEDEFDAIGNDLHKVSNCLAELRREAFGMARELEVKITEIDALLHAKPKEKEGKDGKDQKDKDKEKETKEGKDKEKEGKDGKDKEKDHKDGKEKDHKEALDQKAVPVENLADPSVRGLARPPATGDEPQGGLPDDPPGAPPAAAGRTFIRPEERPEVGERARRAAGGG